MCIDAGLLLQTDSFLSKRERHPLSQKVKLPEDKGPGNKIGTATAQLLLVAIGQVLIAGLHWLTIANSSRPRGCHNLWVVPDHLPARL